MITNSFNGKTYEFRGLSTDTKPTEEATNGSIFFEMDTCKVFMFNGDSKTWVELQ